MRKRAVLLTFLLLLALVVTAVGCGGDDDGEETPTPTPIPTEGGATPTPVSETPSPQYTGESVKFKVSHQGMLGTTTADRWEYIDEQLQYYTNGECELVIYPASSLYRGLEEWDAISSGALDMMVLSSWQPTMQGMMDWQIMYMGFFWGETWDEAKDHWMRFVEHPDGGQKLMAQLESQNIKGLGFYPTGALTMNVNKDTRIYQLREMEGWKAFSVGGFSDILVQASGLTPVFLDPAEGRIAFEQGLVDTINAGPSGVLTTKLYEIAPYGLVSSATAGSGCISMNLNRWNSLSPELQDIWLNKILPDVHQWSLENDLPYYLWCLEELEKLGMTIDWIPFEERMALRDVCWEMGWDRGYLGEIDQEMLKIADRLRKEPYDTGYFFP